MFGNDDKKTDDAPNVSQINEQDAQDLANAVQAISDENTIAGAPQDNFSPTAPAVGDQVAAPATPADTIVPGAPAADPAADSILAKPLHPSPAKSAGADGLLDLKQNALEQLKPLVNHLDSVPEEKFDALMMMIRASDDQSLIQPAYDTAQKITDDKKRAEALLDIVNEINYLTSAQQ